MPKVFKQLDRDAYCSAPPLSTTSLRPPRLTRETEARRPRTPLVETKREVTSSIESAEFVVDKDFDLKPDIKVELDPRQLRRGLARQQRRPQARLSGASEVRPCAGIQKATWAQGTHPGVEADQRGPRPGPRWLSA